MMGYLKWVILVFAAFQGHGKSTDMFLDTEK